MGKELIGKQSRQTRQFLFHVPGKHREYREHRVGPSANLLDSRDRDLVQRTEKRYVVVLRISLSLSLFDSRARDKTPEITKMEHKDAL